MKKLLRKRWLGLWFAVLCAAACIVTLWLHKEISAGLESQTAAERWQAGDTVYVQVSAFISEDASLSSDDITSVRDRVDDDLTSLGLEAAGEDARLWLDAYSGEASMTVSRDDIQKTVRIIATGGDFFFFHPLDMEDGWYYSDSDTDDAVVLLDKELAWALFGGTDLSGMTVELGGTICTVVGVADLPADRQEQDAYGSSYTLYVPYSFLERLGCDIPITCYEAVLPEVTTGSGQDTVEIALSLPEEDLEMRTDTGRFSLKESLALLGKMSQRAQRTKGISYPWWENGALAVEGQCARLAALACLLAVYPAAYIVVTVARALIWRKHSKGRT